MRRTTQQDIAIDGLHLIGAIFLGLLFVAAILYGPELMQWYLEGRR